MAAINELVAQFRDLVVTSQVQGFTPKDAVAAYRLVEELGVAQGFRRGANFHPGAVANAIESGCHLDQTTAVLGDFAFVLATTGFDNNDNGVFMKGFNESELPKARTFCNNVTTVFESLFSKRES